MTDALSIAVSGLQVAQKQVAVSSNNLVNRQSEGFTPQVLAQSSQATGGVTATLRPVDPAFILATDTDGETVALPNVNEISDAVTMKTARHAYEASLALIRSDEEMTQEMLSLVS